MRALVLSGLFTVVAACQPAPGPAAKVWTPREYFAKRTVTEPVFGGWAPADLLVEAGQRIPFSTRTQAMGEGLTVFPGVSAGRAVGFVITDIWQDHPDPWVQPVWMPATPGTPPVRRRDVNTIFPVGLDSTFYSPWWRAQLVPVSDEDAATLTSARAVLRHESAFVDGPLVLCPIISPSTVRVAADGTGATRHPLTGALLVSPEPSTAWVEGVETPYLSFGPGLAPLEGQLVAEAELFVFTQGGAALPVAAVLPDDARGRAFLRRVEVPLPEGAAVFVPSNRPDLAARLGPLAPTVSPALDSFPEYALRVARKPDCFQAGFPASCDWLDSPAKLRTLPPFDTQVRRAVVVTAPTLLERTP
ncbi:MAG: hypothetical protein JNJ54_32780 [Myxococcaceae bacterium]|nr:hypothetical protein [Myxococcaceae bacterium]